MQNDPMEVDLVKARADMAEENKDLPRRKDTQGRTVPVKNANKPFFVYQDYREQQAKLEAEKVARRKEREEKIARGEDPGPDPDVSRLPSAATVFRTLLIILAFTAYAGYFVKGDWKWGYESKWLTTRHYMQFIPDGVQMAYTEQSLARFDGTDPEKPLLLALDGIVYDVSKGQGRRIYGPGGGYHQFAGKDAARAYVTGCFKLHQTHDTRGFNEQELKSLKKWKDFYANHKDYKKVGTVYHAPIDPESPLPPPCDNQGNAITTEQAPKQTPTAAPPVAAMETPSAASGRQEL
ncbi:hypothetical protein FRB96_000257 [Tulasnella sp. 330]|nr:hypothetical protein FRB96_000257 [Tulasnella sp. 330]KAG8886530.1 hypothetical protein FRB97_003041 [Tulasnella sp. 331]KAG8889787.1 hypothetical protein FRB98_002709 [Tulasnella sp. 332]